MGHGILIMVVGCLVGQDPPLPTTTAPPVSAAWQSRVESRYREFETLLSRMADTLGPTDPERAALLRKAFSESRRGLVVAQLQEIVQRMEKGEFPQAIKDQEDALKAMNDVLEILLDESQNLQKQGDRQELEEQIQEAKRLSNEQRQIQERTKRSAPRPDEPTDPSETLPQEQKKLADSADRFAKKLQTKGQSPEGESAPGQSPKPSNENAPSASPEKQGDPSAAGSASAAEKAMREAEKKLAEKKTEEANKEQQKAIDELEKTIEKLQEMIEQRREEERQELLARLEARLSQIKEMQQEILTGTIELDKRASSERTRADELRCRQLSKSEKDVVSGLEQVLVLLVEDGTAVAFPETMEQLARDAQGVAGELAELHTGTKVQLVEKEIIETLDEMVSALDKAKTNKPRSSKKGSPSGGKSGKHPLVEQLAELKMIRSLQLRINERTAVVEQTLSQGSDPNDQVKMTIEELADRQHRVYEITRDVAEGNSP
jgi:uncharacterized phage infection (PIP) family protein YhgE